MVKAMRCDPEADLALRQILDGLKKLREINQDCVVPVLEELVEMEKFNGSGLVGNNGSEEEKA